MGDLSTHFSLQEFACNDRARTPYPKAWIETRLRPLVRDLEVIRAEVNGPIVLTSGYRTWIHNRLIRGAYNSQHVQGRAVDFFCPDMPTLDVYHTMLRLMKEKRITNGGLGFYPIKPGREHGWIHFDTHTPRRWTL